jgi:hypothetical protein
MDMNGLCESVILFLSFCEIFSLTPRKRPTAITPFRFLSPRARARLVAATSLAAPRRASCSFGTLRLVR